MRAKLSLKGILNQWHLNCLCWDRFQKSRTLSNMLGRISHSSDFLSRVNNTICRDIFIHWQSLPRSLLPLTHIMYTLISICPWSSSYRSFPELYPSDDTHCDHWCRCCCSPVFQHQTENRKIILKHLIGKCSRCNWEQSGDWLISLYLTSKLCFYWLWIWHTNY